MWPHMRRMGIRELRDTLTQAIRLVRAGETIEVTHDGEPVALITPVPVDRVGRLVAAGEATRGAPGPLPRGGHPVTGRRTAAQAIAEDRADR
jgi:antitoxin (DNA-binding transcriptional repressor) of toxin-antitoxin stability system